MLGISECSRCQGTAIAPRCGEAGVGQLGRDGRRTTCTKNSSICRTTRDELLEVDRLGDVGVGVQLVAAQHVLLGLGGREHDDRDRRRSGSALIAAEHLAAVASRGRLRSSRIRSGRRRVRVLALAGAGTPAPRRRRVTTCSRLRTLCSANASWVIRTSPGSSSTSRTSIGVRAPGGHVVSSSVTRSALRRRQR